MYDNQLASVVYQILDFDLGFESTDFLNYIQIIFLWINILGLLHYYVTNSYYIEEGIFKFLFIIFEVVYLRFVYTLLCNSLLGMSILFGSKKRTEIDPKIQVWFGSRFREKYLLGIFLDMRVSVWVRVLLETWSGVSKMFCVYYVYSGISDMFLVLYTYFKFWDGFLIIVSSFG